MGDKIKEIDGELTAFNVYKKWKQKKLTISLNVMWKKSIILIYFQPPPLFWSKKREQLKEGVQLVRGHLLSEWNVMHYRLKVEGIVGVAGKNERYKERRRE